MVATIKGVEWTGTEGLARLVLLQTLAQVAPDYSNKIDELEASFDIHGDAPYSCVLDGVQFVQIGLRSKSTLSAAPGLRDSVDSALSINNRKFQLKFHYTRRMAEILRQEAEKEARLRQEQERIQAEEDEKRRKKYEIVDKIRAEIEFRDRSEQISLVDKYAADAQREFMAISMKELAASGDFECPKKYLN